MHAYERSYKARLHEACRLAQMEGVGAPAPELSRIFVAPHVLPCARRERAAQQVNPPLVAPVPERIDAMGLADPWRVCADDSDETNEKRAQGPPPPVPLSAALRDHLHLVVLGEPGSGKSTTLQFLALCSVADDLSFATLNLAEERIPVWLPLRCYDGGCALLEMLADAVAGCGKFDTANQQMSRTIAAALLDTWLRERRLLLLLDALDEVPAQQRAAVLAKIEQFATTPEGQGCRIILTSRLAGSSHSQPLASHFAQVVIQPLTTAKDALSFVIGWAQALAPPILATEQAAAQAKDLIEQMTRQKGLRRSAGNPLLLRLAISVSSHAATPVRTRAEIYRRYLDEVVWPHAQAPCETGFSSDQVQQSSATVAWMLHTRQAATVTELAASIAAVGEGSIDGEQMLAYLQEKLGLLVPRGHRPASAVAFRQLGFQEFLVGQRLATLWASKRRSTWQFMQPRLHDPAWQEPIRLMAGLLEQPAATEVVRRIRHARSPYEAELQRDLLLAATILADGVAVEQALEAELIGQPGGRRHAPQSILTVGQNRAPFSARCTDARWRGAQSTWDAVPEPGPVGQRSPARAGPRHGGS